MKGLLKEGRGITVNVVHGLEYYSVDHLTESFHQRCEAYTVILVWLCLAT